MFKNLFEKVKDVIMPSKEEKKEKKTKRSFWDKVKSYIPAGLIALSAAGPMTSCNNTNNNQENNSPNKELKAEVKKDTLLRVDTLQADTLSANILPVVDIKETQKNSDRDFYGQEIYDNMCKYFEGKDSLLVSPDGNHACSVEYTIHQIRGFSAFYGDKSEYAKIERALINCGDGVSTADFTKEQLAYIYTPVPKGSRYIYRTSAGTDCNGGKSTYKKLHSQRVQQTVVESNSNSDSTIVADVVPDVVPADSVAQAPNLSIEDSFTVSVDSVNVNEEQTILSVMPAILDGGERTTLGETGDSISTDAFKTTVSNVMVEGNAQVGDSIDVNSAKEFRGIKAGDVRDIEATGNDVDLLTLSEKVADVMVQNGTQVGNGIKNDGIASQTATYEEEIPFNFATPDITAADSASFSSTISEDADTISTASKANTVITGYDHVEDSDTLAVGTQSAFNCADRGGYNGCGVKYKKITAMINRWGEDTFQGWQDNLEGHPEYFAKGEVFGGLSVMQALYAFDAVASLGKGKNAEFKEEVAALQGILDCDEYSTMSPELKNKVTSVISRVCTTHEIEGVIYNQPRRVVKITDKGCGKGLSYKIQQAKGGYRVGRGPKLKRVYALPIYEEVAPDYTIVDSYSAERLEQSVPVSEIGDLQVHKAVVKEGQTVYDQATDKSVSLDDFNAEVGKDKVMVQDNGPKADKIKVAKIKARKKAHYEAKLKKDQNTRSKRDSRKFLALSRVAQKRNRA